MPRGGKHGPDGYSPYKTADGRELKLLKSSRNVAGGGYLNIVKNHGKRYYAKKKLDLRTKCERFHQSLKQHQAHAVQLQKDYESMMRSFKRDSVEGF